MLIAALNKIKGEYVEKENASESSVSRSDSWSPAVKKLT